MICCLQLNFAAVCSYLSMLVSLTAHKIRQRWLNDLFPKCSRGWFPDLALIGEWPVGVTGPNLGPWSGPKLAHIWPRPGSQSWPQSIPDQCSRHHLPRAGPNLAPWAGPNLSPINATNIIYPKLAQSCPAPGTPSCPWSVPDQYSRHHLPQADPEVWTFGIQSWPQAGPDHLPRALPGCFYPPMRFIFNS